MIWYAIAKGAQATLAGFFSAKSQQYSLRTTASQYEYKTAVAELNAQQSKSQIYALDRQYDEQYASYGLQAQQVIAATKTSAAARGVKMNQGSAAAATAGAQAVARRDLYNMSLNKLTQVQAAQRQAVSYQAEATIYSAMANAYNEIADDINPIAYAVANGTAAFLGNGGIESFTDSTNSGSLIDFSSTSASTQQASGYGLTTSGASLNSSLSSTSASSGYSLFGGGSYNEQTFGSFFNSGYSFFS